MSLKEIVERSDSTAGRVFDLVIQVFIVISLISFSIETLPDLSASARRVLRTVEVVTVLLFTAEYLLRLAVADHRLRFATSFFGIVDLVAIAPFYLAVGVDLRAIRIFRILRIFRIFKLLRYGDAVNRFGRAIRLAREELVLFFFASCTVIYVAAIGIYYFEHSGQPEEFGSVFHSLWWAVATLTTVGYGDVYPITIGGKIFTFIILMIGLGFVAVPAGVLASALAEVRRSDEG